MQQSQRCSWGAGGEGFEDVGTIRESARDQVEDRQAQLVDRVVVSFCRLLEPRRGEQGGWGPDVGAHEEATGEDVRGCWGKGGADVEPLRDWRD